DRPILNAHRQDADATSSVTSARCRCHVLCHIGKMPMPRRLSHRRDADATSCSVTSARRRCHSWVCWLDYILDISVPTRIVSEDPTQNFNGFLRITQSKRIVTPIKKYRRL